MCNLCALIKANILNAIKRNGKFYILGRVWEWGGREGQNIFEQESGDS